MMRCAVLVGAVVLACGVWFAGAAQDVADQSGIRLPAFKPVMVVTSLMKEQDRHFDDILDLLRDADARKRFERLEHAAQALAEMANINGYHEGSRKHDDYRNWAGQLKDQALELATFAKAKNIGKAKKMVRQMNATCKACHDKHAD